MKMVEWVFRFRSIVLNSKGSINIIPKRNVNLKKSQGNIFCFVVKKVHALLLVKLFDLPHAVLLSFLC